VKSLLYMFGDIVMFVVAVIALYWSWESVHVSWKFGSVTTGSGSARPYSSSRCPSALRSSSSASQSFLRDLADLRNGRPVYEGDKLFD
jgi:hypothetical protein